jgi:hypothetical protein
MAPKIFIFPGKGRADQIHNKAAAFLNDGVGMTAGYDTNHNHRRIKADICGKAYHKGIIMAFLIPAGYDELGNGLAGQVFVLNIFFHNYPP